MVRSSSPLLCLLALSVVVSACGPLAPPAALPAGPAPAPTTSAAQQVPREPTSNATKEAPAPFLESLPAEQATLFRAGYAALAAGAAAEAEAAFGRLAELPFSGEPEAEARLRLGQAHLQAGRSEEALGQLRDVEQRHSGTGQAEQARYFEATALLASGQVDEARQRLGEVARQHPQVAAAIWLRVAEHALEAGDYQDARDAATEGVATAQARALRAELLELLGEAESRLGNPEAAFDAYRQTLALAQGTSYLGEQLYELGRSYQRIGKSEDAVRTLQAAVTEFPAARSTADALRLLADLGGLDDLDRYELGRARFHAGEYYLAALDLDAYLAADPDGVDADQARLYRALAQMAYGPDPEAVEQLERLGREAQDEEAAALALVEAGRALEQLFRYDQADAVYRQVLDRYPSADSAPRAAFRLGFARYLDGQHEQAIQAWEDLLRSEPGDEDRARALYWLGKAAAALQRREAARDYWQQAAELEPATSYSLRAHAALAGAGEGASGRAGENGLTFVGDTDMGQWFAERRLNLDQAADVASSDPDYLRARELAGLGLYREANWQAEALLTRHREWGDRLFWLAERFHELGLYAGGVLLGREAMVASGVHRPTQAPPPLLRAAYPLAFEPALEQAVSGQELDPLLLLSLVRQESGFATWSEAPGQAAGLAHLRPVQVEEASAALADGASARPRVSGAPLRDLELAAWFLADRLRRYDGQVAPVLAAFSISEAGADAWLAYRGTEDPDVFVEQIPFDGTRAYILAVQADEYLYETLYGSGEPTAEAQPPYTLENASADIRRLRESLATSAPLAPIPVDVPAELTQTLGAGAALRREGRCTEARPLLERAVSSDLAAYAHLELAECASQAGDHREALAQLTSARERFGPRLLTLDARERSAEALLGLGRPQDVLQAYQGLLEETSYAPYRAQLRHNLAAVRLALGERDAAVAQLRQALAEDPQGLAGQAALAQLERLGARDAAPYEAGMIRFHEKRYREAVAYFDAALDAGGASGRVASARYHRAVSLLRLGQERLGVDELLALAREMPGSQEAPEALLKAGRVLESLKDYGGAADAYRALASGFPASAFAPDARFRAAFVRYQQGDYAAAAEGWRALAAGGPAEVRAPAQFWLGKALERLGDSEGARSNWRVAAQVATPSYYSARAVDLLSSVLTPTIGGAELSAEQLGFTAEDRASVERWAAAQGASTEQLDADLGLRRAQHLLGLGLRAQARWELQDAAARMSESPARSALLAVRLNQWGVYDLSVKTALRASWAAGAPAALQKLVYPVPFPELVLEMAARHGADPLLFSALMRQESLFDQFARSPSHARGLTQVIPSTGYEIAERLGYPNFQATHLFRPEVSIEFGAWYIARRVERFGGMPLPALAAYNGGDIAVDSWLLAYGDQDPDAFVEGIPFSETQPYVQHIYEFWQTYRDLYDGKQ